MATQQRQPNDAADKVAVDAFKDRMAKYAPTIGTLLKPARRSFEAFRTLALNAATRNPTILKCTPTSVFVALVQCAELELDPGGTTKQAHLVPFWSNKAKSFECQLIIGYQGYVNLAYRSSLIASVEGVLVWIDDEFEIKRHRTPPFFHRQKWGAAIETEDGKPLPLEECIQGAYMIARTKRGGVVFTPLHLNEIVKRRAVSQSWKDENKRTWSPWTTWPLEMAQKTAIRRGANFLPLTPELERAIQIEDLADEGKPDAKYHDAFAGMAALPTAHEDEIADAIAGAQTKESREAVPVEAKPVEKPAEKGKQTTIGGGYDVPDDGRD